MRRRADTTAALGAYGALCVPASTAQLHTQRNLTPLQQARLSLAIGDYEHEREAAKERQGKRTDIPASRPEGSAKDGEALAHVSATTGVPVRTLRRTAFVEKNAVPEVRTSQHLSVSDCTAAARH